MTDTNSRLAAHRANRVGEKVESVKGFLVVRERVS